MQNRTSLERGTQLPAVPVIAVFAIEQVSSKLQSSVERFSVAGSHGRFEKLPVKKRTHVASSGHVPTSQPWIVQYPPLELESHWRSPFGLQSELTMHSSPISLPHPAAATPSSITQANRMIGVRILAAVLTPSKRRGLPAADEVSEIARARGARPAVIEDLETGPEPGYVSPR